MNETELLINCMRAAHELDVLAYHDSDARRSLGPRGFPDLVLVGQALELWELKSATGALEAGQTLWIRRLKGAGATVRLVTPDMWPDEVYALLRAIRGR